jgi:hypothetical protein
MNYFGPYAAILYGELSYAYRKFETPRSGAARIEEQNSVASFTSCNMAVAGDYDLKSRCLGFEIESRQLVQHINGDTVHFENLSLRQLSRPCFFVDVAANRSAGCNSRERFQNLRRADVSRMNDPLRPLQRGQGFRPQKAMCVGDDADEDRLCGFQCWLRPISRFTSACDGAPSRAA